VLLYLFGLKLALKRCENLYSSGSERKVS